MTRVILFSTSSTTAPVKAFWKNLLHWLASNVDVHLRMHEEDILFGILKDALQAESTNFILILAKFFIFCQRLFHQGRMNLLHFLNELKMKIQVEKLIFIQENKPHKFRRWKRISQALV